MYVFIVSTISATTKVDKDPHNPNNPSHPVQRFFKETQKERQKKMDSFCKNYTVPKDLNYNKNFIFSDKKSFTYCRVPKAACKTWKKIVGYVEGFFDSPFNVSHKQVGVIYHMPPFLCYFFLRKMSLGKMRLKMP